MCTCSSFQIWPPPAPKGEQSGQVCSYLQSTSLSTPTTAGGSRRSPPRCRRCQCAGWARWTCSVFPGSAPEGEPAEPTQEERRGAFQPGMGKLWPEDHMWSVELFNKVAKVKWKVRKSWYCFNSFLLSVLIIVTSIKSWTAWSLNRVVTLTFSP